MVSNDTYKPRYRNGKVFYRSAELQGYWINDSYHSPERMFLIHKFYEEKLKRRKYRLVRELEKKRGLPETWLNSVISGLIKDSLNGLNGVVEDVRLAEDLVEEFKDRGYSDGWLNQG